MGTELEGPADSGHAVSWLQRAYKLRRTGRADEAGQAVREIAGVAPDFRLAHVP